MPRRSLKGTCFSCKKEFSKSGMARHLAACKERAKTIALGDRQKHAVRRRILQLLVEGYDRPQYWKLVEVDANIGLKKLDNYLRDFWLECCGHLSAFFIGDDQYGVTADSSMRMKSMRAKLGDLVGKGDCFGYDFGTTTTLRFEIIDEREGTIAANNIRLLAKNVVPDLRCECDKPATLVCAQCIWETEECWFCDDCADDHPCGEEMMLPNADSPRVGMCSYGG